MDLIKLPIEIQQYILSFLDTSSLIQCSRVCVLWQTLSQGCWQHCCLREISSEVLVEILGTCQPLKQLFRLNGSFMWENLFLRWNHYSAIAKIPHQTFGLPFRNTNASNRCVIRLSGDFLIIAPTVENVRVYKVHIYENGKCVGIVAKHKKTIQDIALMDLQKLGPYNLRGSYKLSEHDVIISVSLDRTIHLSEINCQGRIPLKLWEKKLSSDCIDATLKVFGNTFILGTQDRTIYVWSVSTCKARKCRVVELAQILTPIPLTHVSIWKDKITCLWWSLPGVHLMTWDMTTNSWSENRFIENILCGPNIVTFRNLIFGVGAQLTVLKNGQFFHKYDLWETLGQGKVPVEKISAVCLKRNLLVIGCGNEVSIFLINFDNQLKDLKSVTPLNTIQVLPRSFPYAQHEIRNLDVSFDGRGLQIAVQTTLEVHVIRWFPFDKSFLNTAKSMVELPSLCSSDDINESGELSDPDYWFYDSD